MVSVSRSGDARHNARAPHRQVARDAEEIRPQRALLRVESGPREKREKAFLRHVFGGVNRAREAPGEAKDRRPVALVEREEGGLFAAARSGQQPGVIGWCLAHTYILRASGEKIRGPLNRASQ